MQFGKKNCFLNEKIELLPSRIDQLEVHFISEC